jgi:hypothetical protein
VLSVVLTGVTLPYANVGPTELDHRGRRFTVVQLIVASFCGDASGGKSADDGGASVRWGLS